MEIGDHSLQPDVARVLYVAISRQFLVKHNKQIIYDKLPPDTFIDEAALARLL